jgi:hypothetical protein
METEAEETKEKKLDLIKINIFVLQRTSSRR